MSQAGIINVSGGGTGTIQTLTGNTGGAVPPTANNINIVGTTGLVVTGNPGTSTLTVSIQTEIASAYTDVTSAMSPYVVTTTDYFLSVNASGGNVTILLPNSPTSNREFVIKDRLGQATTNVITITTVGGTVTIDGQTTYPFTDNYESLDILFHGTNYEVF